MTELQEILNFLVAPDYANGGHVAYCLDCDFYLRSSFPSMLAKEMAAHYRSHIAERTTVEL